MTDEIKPVRCGCGGEAEVYVYSMDGGFWHRYNVECTKCNVRTPKYDIEAEAVTAWNRAMGERTAKVKKQRIVPTDLGIGIIRGYCECGRMVSAMDKYCPDCGARLEW